MFEARNILKKQSKFCMFNVDNFLLNDENSTHSMNIITQSLYNLVRLKYTIFFEENTKICMFNLHNFSENVEISVHSTNIVT